MKIMFETLEYLEKVAQSEYFKIILSFILGFLSNYGIAKVIEQQKLNKLRKFYLSWLNFSLVNVSKQKERLEKYKSLIDTNTNYSGNLEFNKNQLDKIATLSKEELYDIFVLRKKGDNKLNAKKLHELVECIDYLILFDIEIYNRYNEFRNEIKQLNIKLSSENNNFNSIVDTYILEYKNTMGAYTDQIIELKENLSDKYTEENITPHIIFEEFVIPVREIFSSHLFFQNDDLIRKGRESTQELKNIFSSKDRSYSVFSHTLGHYITQINNTITNIHEKINFFEKN